MLGEAATNGDLTDWQEQRILLIEGLIRISRNEAKPGSTERWQLVGPVLKGLRYLAKEGLKDAFAWWKVGEILAQIDWHNVERTLHGHPSTSPSSPPRTGPVR